MTNQNKKIKKEKEQGVKIDFPTLSLESALKITKNVLSKYADIIPYEKLAGIVLGREITRGGQFGNLTKSLKMYNFMERYSKTEMKVTDFGHKVANAGENELKSLLFKSFIGVPIFNELYGRYKTTAQRKALTDYIISKGVEKREAGRLVGSYIKNYDYLGLNGASQYNVSEGNVELEKETKEEQEPVADKKSYSVFLNAGALFGVGVKDKKKKLKELLSSSKEYGLNKFSGFLDAIMTIYGDKSESELDAELKKIGEKAISLIEEDLGISHNNQSD